jgi:predicted nucleotidyltransferase
LVDNVNSPIFSYINALHNEFPSPFILIGGAAVVSIGSRRTTKDVDILALSDINLEAILMSLQTVNGFSITDGTLYFKSDTGDLAVTIDILTNIVQRADF